MMKELSQIISQIKPVEPEWLTQAQERLDFLTKPPGSLGRLEELAARYVAIRGELFPRLEKKQVVVFAADHGVVAEGVSAFPQEVTPQMVLNFLRGGAGINVLARHAGAAVEVVDIGVNYDFGAQPGLVSRKVAFGSRNMAQEPALTREEAVQALLVGVELAEMATASGMDAMAAGDMGIGNTTPAAALASTMPETKATTAYPNASCGRIYVDIGKSTERQRSAADIAKELREKVGRLVGAEYVVLDDLNNGAQKPVQIRFYGTDTRKLQQITQDFQKTIDRKSVV